MKNLEIVILLKIITKGILFEKKKQEIILRKIYFHQNIRKELSNLKKVKEVIKEKIKLV